MSESANYFTNLASIDVNEFLEKKGEFSYLPWSRAVMILLKHHPTATWEPVKFPDANGREVLPFLKTELGYFVEVSVTVEGIRRSITHPVMDDHFSPIFDPTSFDVNTSVQRALVKAIALHGLGLYVYAGDDFPLMTSDLPDGEMEMNDGDNDQPQLFKLDDVIAVQGENGPYYMLTLCHGDTKVEVAIIGQGMEMFEKLNIHIGDQCEVKTFELAGKTVAEDIRKVS